MLFEILAKVMIPKLLFANIINRLYLILFDITVVCKQVVTL